MASCGEVLLWRRRDLLMAIQTAVILAAGQGIRLGPLGRMIPKGCIQVVPDGARIVEESIGRLRSRGITRIVLVSGHLRHHYDDLQANGLIQMVHNPHFATSGSMDSLACARDVLGDDDEFLLLESDLVYEVRALDAALDSPRADVVVLSGPTGSGDEVYVEANGHTIAAITKDRAILHHSAGELVGISRISRTLFARMLDYAAENPHTEYETGALAAVARSYPVYYSVVPDLVWAEIDTPAHLDRVRRHVYPALQQRDPVSAPDPAVG
jgi:choline kinase